MKLAIFSAYSFERRSLELALGTEYELKFFENRLSEQTAELAAGCAAASIFINDDASAAVLRKLAAGGTRLLALRSAGYNHVDLSAANELNLTVSRVPAYSPYAIAEHTVALMLALNRRLIRAHHRITDLNFSLDGLVGFDMHGKTVGIIGTGKIGRVCTDILHGFGCHLLGYDLHPDEEWAKGRGLRYAPLTEVLAAADIVTLQLPLTDATHHLIDAQAIASMKPGVMLINTSRGGLVDTPAAIAGLKSGQIGYFGLDVYEEENGLFLEDHSDEDLLQDETITQLMTFRNVLITSHQAFLTRTALENIATTTAENVRAFAAGERSGNEVK